MKCPLCTVVVLDLSQNEERIVVGAIARCPCCQSLIKFEVKLKLEFGVMVSKTPGMSCKHAVAGWFR